jgi:hypothetical protein
VDSIKKIRVIDRVNPYCSVATNLEKHSIMAEKHIHLNHRPLVLYVYALKVAATKAKYPEHLGAFLEFIGYNDPHKGEKESRGRGDGVREKDHIL